MVRRVWLGSPGRVVVHDCCDDDSRGRVLDIDAGVRKADGVCSCRPACCSRRLVAVTARGDGLKARGASPRNRFVDGILEMQYSDGENGERRQMWRIELRL